MSIYIISGPGDVQDRVTLIEQSPIRTFRISSAMEIYLHLHIGVFTHIQ